MSVMFSNSNSTPNSETSLPRNVSSRFSQRHNKHARPLLNKHSDSKHNKISTSVTAAAAAEPASHHAKKQESTLSQVDEIAAAPEKSAINFASLEQGDCKQTPLCNLKCQQSAC